MGLLDLTTNLRSLKYGRDQKGGGSSNQPFIQTPIPGYNEEFDAPSTDFLLRAGALSRGVKDVERLGKFLTTVDGVLFLAKQTALSTHNPLVPGKPNRQTPVSGFYNPLFTLGQVAGNAIGLHTERQGLFPINDPQEKYFSVIKNNYNTTSTNRLSILYNTKILETPETVPNLLALGAFGVDPTSPTDVLKYPLGAQVPSTVLKISSPTIGPNNLPEGEPLETYQVGRDPFFSRGGYKLGNEGINSAGVSTAYFALDELNGNSIGDPELGTFTGINPSGQSTTYFGVTGDNSTLSTNSRGLTLVGSGSYQTGTYRKFYDNGGWRLGSEGIRPLGASVEYAIFGVNGQEPLGPGEFESLTGINEEGQQVKYFGPQDDNSSFSTDNKGLILTGSEGYQAQKKDIEFSNLNKSLGASQKEFIATETFTGINEEGQQTKLYGPQDDNSTLSKNKKGQILKTYQVGIENSLTSRSDTPTYSATGRDGESFTANSPTKYRSYALKKGVSDPIGLSVSTPNRDANLESEQICKFFFEILNNDAAGSSEFVYFRAYIGNIKDSYSADWSDVKYSGRAEKFYQYKGFTRDVGIDFQLVAHTEAELNVMYQKMNKLTDMLTPDYSDLGYMRGTIIKLTVGDYFKSLPCVLKSVDFSGHFDTGWEIVEGKQVPKYLSVGGLSFSPIHNFLPQKGAQFYNIAGA